MEFSAGANLYGWSFQGFYRAGVIGSKWTDGEFYIQTSLLGNRYMRGKEKNLRPAKSEAAFPHPQTRPVTRVQAPPINSTNYMLRSSVTRKFTRSSQPALPQLYPPIRGFTRAAQETPVRVQEISCYLHSITGGSHTRQKPYNQDSGVICKIETQQPSHLLLVCDGHGDFGHLVSNRIVETFPKLLKDGMTKHQGRRFDGTVIALRETCLAANEDLRTSGLSCRSSGSTCVAVIVQSNRLICSNVGDSRAILGRHTPNGYLPFSLSHDHKPDDPLERTRIEQAGGRVAADSQQPYGSARVWFADEEGPGLAMSRAFGDFDAQEIGVVGVPDITVTPRMERDLCVIVASDGVWEYVTETEAVELVEQASLQGERALAAEKLASYAAERWKARGSRRDDITAIVAFLDQ